MGGSYKKDLGEEIRKETAHAFHKLFTMTSDTVKCAMDVIREKNRVTCSSEALPFVTRIGCALEGLIVGAQHRAFSNIVREAANIKNEFLSAEPGVCSNKKDAEG